MTAEFLFCSSAPTCHRIADDDCLDEDKQKLIDQYTADFYTAKAKNDVAGMQAAHDNAVAVRLNSSVYETVSRTDYTTGSEIVIVKGNNGVKDDNVGEMLFYPGGVGKGVGIAIGSVTGKLLAKETSKVPVQLVRGTMFEKLILKVEGLVKNTKKIGNSIPDSLTGGRITEIKDAQYVYKSKQFRDYIKSGLPIDLIVRTDTKISKPLEEAIRKSGGSIIRR